MRSTGYKLLCVLFVISAVACSNQPENKHFYSYVDESGRLHTVETEVKPQEETVVKEPVAKPLPDLAEETFIPQSDSPFGRFGRASTKVENSTNYSIVGEASQITTSELEAELEDERFIVFPGADGQLVRQKYDANEVKAIEKATRQARAEIQDYQWISDTYVEATVEIEVGCCSHLIAKAEELPVKGATDVEFSATQAQQIQLAAQSPTWPARLYKLPAGISAVLIKSYKKKKQYLHPQLLLLDDAGEPVLQVSNVFSKRYPETWARHGYMEGALIMEPNYRYLLLYLGYEEGQVEGLPFDVEKENSLSLDGVVQLSTLK